MALDNVELWLCALLLYVMVPFVAVVLLCACYTVPWIERVRRVVVLHQYAEEQGIL